MINIVKVDNKKEQKRFINFPIKLYDGNKYYVPLLYSSEKEIFKTTYPYNKVCETIFFNAYLDGLHVGRIQGIIQTPANEKWNQKRVRFTRFDSIDNQEVANALFDAVIKWAKEKGMNEFVGPLGYSDLEREGLLIEGFDQLQTYEEQYNFEYYQRLIENYGFVKDVDWIEYKVYAPKEKNEKLISVSKKMLERYNVRLVQEKRIGTVIKKYGKQLFEMIDLTYSRLYGTMPLNEEIVNSLISSFKLIVRPQDVALLLNDKDEIVGFALGFPSISDAVRLSKGHITLPFIIRFLKAKRNPKVLDLGLIGISPEYESKGVIGGILSKLLDYISDNDFDHFETNLVLEDNAHMQNLYKHFEREQNKRRRCYKLELKDE